MNIFRNAAALLLALFVVTFSRAAEPVTLRFVVWDGDEAAKVLREELGRFEAAHPNIKVKFETANFDTYFDKLLVQYAAGVAPDVAMMNPDFFQRFARRGALMPLDDFFGQTPGFDIKSYYSSITESMQLDGKLYVLPRDIAPIAIVYYNKKMFRDLGIPYPDGKWTWDYVEHPELGDHDFLTLLKKFQKVGPTGKVVQWGYVPGWADLLTDMAVFSTGARYWDDPKDPTKILYDDPRIVKAHQFVADLTLKYKYSPSTFDQAGTSSKQLFTQQKVAMFHSGIWETPQLRKEISPLDKGGFDWDIALAPAYHDGTRAYSTGGSGYGIMSSTKHPKEAWILTEWFAGEHGMLAMAKAGIAQPAIRKLALQEPWIPGPNTPAEQQVPHNRIITDQAEPFVVFANSGIFWKEVSDIAKQPTVVVYTGDIPAKEALDKSNVIAQNRLTTLRKELDLKPFDWGKAGVIGVLIALGIAVWVYLPERSIRRSNRETRENRAAYAFLAPWLIGLVGFTAGPMILSLIMSFSDWDIIRAARWRGIGNYVEAFSVDPTFWKSLSVTLVYTLVSVPLGIAMSLGLALLLNIKVKGIALWRTCYYMPAIASPIATSLIWQKLFQPEGGFVNSVIFGPDGHGGIPLLNNLLAPLAGSNGQINWLQNEKTALPALIMMSVFGAGGGMVILLAALQGVPQYYYEAATLDGAGPLRRFRNVTVPLISPALFFTLITGFIGSFQVFTQAFQMTLGGPNNATMFFMLHTYNNAFRTLRMGYASSLAWVLFFVVLMFTVLQLQSNRFVYYEGSER